MCAGCYYSDHSTKGAVPKAFAQNGEEMPNQAKKRI